MKNVFQEMVGEMKCLSQLDEINVALNKTIVALSLAARRANDGPFTSGARRRSSRGPLVTGAPSLLLEG